jgi:hypothetical protein
MPDVLVAVLAFVGGAVTNALIGLAQGEYRARRDHQRAVELDRSSRDRQAAAAILEEIDRLMEKYSPWAREKVAQSEVEPHYRVIRRRAVEIGDPVARALANEIASGYYFVVTNAMYIGGNERTLARLLHDIAQEALGPVVRGDKPSEPEKLARFRKIAKSVDDWFQTLYDDDQAAERAASMTDTSET